MKQQMTCPAMLKNSQLINLKLHLLPHHYKNLPHLNMELHQKLPHYLIINLQKLQDLLHQTDCTCHHLVVSVVVESMEQLTEEDLLQVDSRGRENFWLNLAKAKEMGMGMA